MTMIMRMKKMDQVVPLWPAHITTTEFTTIQCGLEMKNQVNPTPMRESHRKNS
jgi:hypothetical protein